MNPILLTDADGSEGLPICRAQREWLVSRYKSEPMIALKFFTDDLPVGGLDASTDAKAIDHVRKMPEVPRLAPSRRAGRRSPAAEPS